MAWLSLLLKGKKVAGAIKSVKPQVKYTGTKSLIDKYKKVVAKVPSTEKTIPKKQEAVKDILKFSKKHGGTQADEAAGASIKRNEASKKIFKSAQGKK